MSATKKCPRCHFTLGPEYTYKNPDGKDISDTVESLFNGFKPDGNFQNPYTDIMEVKLDMIAMDADLKEARATIARQKTKIERLERRR